MTLERKVEQTSRGCASRGDVQLGLVQLLWGATRTSAELWRVGLLTCLLWAFVAGCSSSPPGTDVEPADTVIDPQDVVTPDEGMTTDTSSTQTDGAGEDTADTVLANDATDASVDTSTSKDGDGEILPDANGPDLDAEPEPDTKPVSCGSDADCPAESNCAQGVCVVDVCTAGTTCAGAQVAVCQANGGKLELQTCPEGQGCWNAKCEPLSCTPNEAKCKFADVLVCNPYGTAFTKVVCNKGEFCSNGACLKQVCTPKSVTCDVFATKFCLADGLGWKITPCEANEYCSNGFCQAQKCQPDAKRCVEGLAQKCMPNGAEWVDVEHCIGNGLACTDGDCVPALCEAHATMCSGTDSLTCSANADSWKIKSCLDGNPCTLDGCALATGKCVNSMKDCSDGNVCTVDACKDDVCYTATLLFGGDCQDSQVCVSDAWCHGGSCVADPDNGIVSTFSGSGVKGLEDGTAKTAQFYFPVAIEAMPDGSWIVAQFTYSPLRLVAPNGDVTSLPVVLQHPQFIAVHGDFVYSSSASSNKILKHSLKTGELLATIGGEKGNKDGLKPQFNKPAGLAVDTGGNLWIADRDNNRIRRYDATTGYVSTLASVPKSGDFVSDSEDAVFQSPTAVEALPSGDLIVADWGSGRLLQVEFASGQIGVLSGKGVGSVDGLPQFAKFGSVMGLAYQNMMLWAVEYEERKVRAIYADGYVETIAGGVDQGVINGPVATASFGNLTDVAVNGLGEVMVADHDHHVLRKLDLGNAYCDDKNPCTADGCDQGKCVFQPLMDGSACGGGNKCASTGTCQSSTCTNQGIKTCSDGTACTVDSCDWQTGECVFTPVPGDCDDNDTCTLGEVCAFGKCEVALSKLSKIAGGYGDGTVLDGNGDDAGFGHAEDIAIWDAQSVIVADSYAQTIRKVTMDGTVTTIAGSDKKWGFNDGPANEARFNAPSSLVTASGVIWIADRNNHRIRMLKDGTVSTVAGSGTKGFADGPGAEAMFNEPTDIARRPDGTLLVADLGNRRIRSIALDGTVTTLAGTGFPGAYDGDALGASFNEPSKLCVDPVTSAVYAVDTGTGTIRRILHGKVDTWYDYKKAVVNGLTGKDWLSANSCEVDGDGGLIVSDDSLHTVGKIMPGNQVTAWTGNSFKSKWYGQEGAVDKATLTSPQGVARLPDGGLWIADRYYIAKWQPAAWDCNDGNPCTNDVCDQATGDCKFTMLNNGEACEDGALCTINSQCVGGECVNGVAPTCDDGDSCTADGCDTNTGCVHLATDATGCCVEQPFATDFLTYSIGQWGISANESEWKYTEFYFPDPPGLSIPPYGALYGETDALVLIPSAPIVTDTAMLKLHLHFDGPEWASPDPDGSMEVLVKVDGVLINTIDAKPSLNIWFDAYVPLPKSTNGPPKIELSANSSGTLGFLYSIRLGGASISQDCGP